MKSASIGPIIKLILSVWLAGFTLTTACRAETEPAAPQAVAPRPDATESGFVAGPAVDAPPLSAPGPAYPFDRNSALQTSPFPIWLEADSAWSPLLSISFPNLTDPVIDVRVLKKGKQAIARLSELIALETTDGELAATLLYEDRDQLAGEMQWSLRNARPPFRLKFKENLLIAVKSGATPLHWDYRPGDPLRPNPFADPKLAEKLPPADFFVDYYSNGAYERSYLLSPIRHCARADDYLAVYFRPGAFQHPTIAIRSALEDTTRLRREMWTAYLGERELPPAERPGDGFTELVWELPPDCAMIVLRPLAQNRYGIAVSDGAFAWSEKGASASLAYAPRERQPDPSIRLSVEDVEACFP